LLDPQTDVRRFYDARRERLKLRHSPVCAVLTWVGLCTVWDWGGGGERRVDVRQFDSIGGVQAIALPAEQYRDLHSG